MMQLLNCYFKHRLSWLLLALTAFTIELIALYFQYILQFSPCVLCIYQRFTLYGIFIAGLIGAIAPATSLRFVSLAIWLYSAWHGLFLTVKYINLQLHPSPFVTCNFFVHFPDWLPLNKWLPFVFNASGDCDVLQWHFLSLNISEWMMIIFGCYSAAAAIILLVQFFPQRNCN